MNACRITGKICNNYLLETNPTKIAPKLLNIPEETLYKNVIESNLQGKHPYASLFKSQPIKNIKILPPIVLQPAFISNEVRLKNRRKRNAENDRKYKIKKEVSNPEFLSGNQTKFEYKQNSTDFPIDQVTQAITVSQISGTPPSTNTKQEDLNFQPFFITSSDFKNTSEQNFEQFPNIEDVGKLIQEKLEKISEPDNYENKDTVDENNQENYEEENESVDEAENLEEADKDEETNDKAEIKENNGDYDEVNEEIINAKEENEEQLEDPKKQFEKLIIFVPEQPENSSINEELAEEDIEEETLNLEKELLPEISESFVKHFVELDAYEPEQETHETKQEQEINGIKKEQETDGIKEQEIFESKENEQEPYKTNEKEQETHETRKESAEESKNENKKEEKFYLPFKTSEQIEESNEEIKEKYKYFDDIINHQLEENLKLEKELEFPELDQEYEKFRESSSNAYLQSREADFAEVSKPYIINLKGNFPHEDETGRDDGKNDRKEHHFKDDVDVGTDRERLHEEEVNEESNQDNDEKDNEQYQENSNEDDHEEQNEDEEEKEQFQTETEEEENDKVSSQNQYILIPNKNNRNKLNFGGNADDWSERSKFSIPLEHKLTSLQKYHASIPNEEIKQNIANYLKSAKNKLEDNAKDKTEEQIVREETKNDEIQVTTNENIMDALSSILNKRDALSRQQQIENPNKYNTFWKLEYRNPNPK